MSTQPAHDLDTASQDSTIPITDSQILPLRSGLVSVGQPATPWQLQVAALRRRLAPVRRWVFAGAIVVGSLAGAALFFLTHPANASLDSAASTVETAATANAPSAASTPVAAPAAAAPAKASTERPADAPVSRPVKRTTATKGGAKAAPASEQARRK